MNFRSSVSTILNAWAQVFFPLFMQLPETTTSRHWESCLSEHARSVFRESTCIQFAGSDWLGTVQSFWSSHPVVYPIRELSGTKFNSLYGKLPLDDHLLSAFLLISGFLAFYNCINKIFQAQNFCLFSLFSYLYQLFPANLIDQNLQTHWQSLHHSLH